MQRKPFVGLVALLIFVGAASPALPPACGEEEPPSKAEEAADPAPPWKGVLLPFGTRRLLRDYDEPLGKGKIEGAVDAALAWLAAHQSSDGRWSAQEFASWCHGKQISPQLSDGAYFSSADPGITGLALLAFLGAGHDPLRRGPHASVVRRGLDWLASVQGEDGCIATHESQVMLQSHAYATLAVVEAFGVTGSEPLQRVAQRALDLIAHARNPYFAWRYGIKPGDNDTVVLGACMMPVFAALKINQACTRRGEDAPLTIDMEQLDGALAWVDKMTDPDYGRVGYMQRGGVSSRYVQGGGCDRYPTEFNEGCTAIGLLVKLWAGSNLKGADELNPNALNLLVTTSPTWKSGRVDLYAWMYTALALHQIEVKVSKVRSAVDDWYESLAGTLLAAQRKDGDVCGAKGSWDPEGAWGWAGGRVYATAMAVLALEAPLRYTTPKDELKALAGLAKNDDLSPIARVGILRTIADLDQGTALRGVLTSLLKERDEVLRRHAAQLVPHLKRPSKALAKKLAALVRKDASAIVRMDALCALGKLGPLAEKHGDVIVGALADEHDWVFGAAIRVLWDAQLLAVQASSRLELLLDHESEARATQAASVLYLHDPKHARAGSQLRAAIRADDLAVREALERTLGWSVPPWAKVSDAQIEYALEHDLPAVFEGPLRQGFVLIPPGTFPMGSPEDEKERLAEETLHEVTISKPYFLQIAEVTNSDYRMKDESHLTHSYPGTALDGSLQPAMHVGHVEAQAFADWLSERSEQWTFRLPTEAEWEYAARAGTTTRFWWGEDEAGAAKLANIADAAARRVWPRGFGQFVESTPQWRWFEIDDGRVGTCTAADRGPSPWGLHAMHGNAAEWCADWKGDYPTGPVTDPTGARSGAMRVVRGGSWVGSPQQCRAAMRGLLPKHLQPGAPCPWIGFRLAAEPRADR